MLLMYNICQYFVYFIKTLIEFLLLVAKCVIPRVTDFSKSSFKSIIQVNEMRLQVWLGAHLSNTASSLLALLFEKEKKGCLSS